MPAILIIPQGMLNIAGNRAVHILIRGLLCGKGRLVALSPKSLKITSLSQEPETKEATSTEGPPCWRPERPSQGLPSLASSETLWDTDSAA